MEKNDKNRWESIMKSGTHFLSTCLKATTFRLCNFSRRWLAVLICVAACALSGTAWAWDASFEFSDGLVSSDGNYTVTATIQWPSDCKNQPCRLNYTLYEQPGTNIRSGNAGCDWCVNPAPVTFSINRSKGSGNYSYHLVLNYFIDGEEDPSWDQSSPTVTVIKNDVPVTNAGFHENYEIRRGDINGDGRLDFYIRSKPGNSAPVNDFILRQTSSKEFILFTALTSSQRSQAQGWPLASIELTTGDFNADGAVDILLEGVGSLVSGAFDQLVFSPRAANAPPLVVTALDQQVQKFFAEVGNALYDPNYFQNYAPVAVQQREILDWVFGPEYCFSAPEAEPHGPLEFWPRLGPGEFDSYGAFVSHSAAFLSDCYARGYNHIHYDWLEVIYKVLVGSKDISVFSPDAVAISRVLRTILEDWSLPDGSNEKETIRVILESIFGMPVFGPSLDDDEELRSVLVSLRYLSMVSKGKEAVSQGECPSLPESIVYNIPYNAHWARSVKNANLAPYVSVTGGATQETLITVNVNLGGSGINLDNIVKGIKLWNSCGTLPDSKRVRLVVNVTKVSSGYNVFAQGKTGIDCRDKAQKGGTVMYPCIGEKEPDQILAAKHEFGHIFGLADFYVDVNGRSEPESAVYKTDIMAVSSGMIYPYHLQVLAQRYSSQ